MKKIFLKNTQPLLGDRMMFTPVVRDLKVAFPDTQIGVLSAGPEIFKNNPHIDHDMIEADADDVYNIGPAKVTHGSKTNGLHITSAFRMSLQENSGLDIPQGPFKPDIHLTEAEKNHREIAGPYWVINTDTGPFTAKRWRSERFQQLIDCMPEITFVQVGLKRDNWIRLAGPNVIDMIDQTKIRDLFSLVYNSSGCISLVSSLMHVAAAFDKPAVVLAGGREPFTFEKYANHIYLDKTGQLPCCRLRACWHNALSACEDHDGKVARCMDLISVREVKNAIESYYEGGAIERPGPDVTVRKKPLLKIVSNTKCLGGAERSMIEIARMFLTRGYNVELIANGPVASDIKNALPAAMRISSHLTSRCDILLLYASDMVFNFDKPEFKVFEEIQAAKKVMALKVKPDYTKGTTVVRHSSQGDVKFSQDLPDIMSKCKANFMFMPGPSWLKPQINVTKFPYLGDPVKVAEFLAKGNLFWYLLPGGYTDQGPRVIVEAMAAGLAVLCENRDGPADRVTTETGFKIDSHSEAIDIINSITPEILAKKGRAARERAKSKFIIERWYEQISETIRV
jgi:ADP-heptose:LPS heptosyltransferase